MKFAMGGVKIILASAFICLTVTVNSSQIDYARYADILQKYVTSSGQVNYSGILNEDLEHFNKVIQQFEEVNPKKLDRKNELAFWINAYNAFTIKLILNYWPVSSILDIADGNPWDVEWIEIDDTIYSLNHIEHDIIRKKFDEPRIHFAVNCAAISCPVLLNQPYIGSMLDQQLQTQTRLFVNDKNKNRISPNSIQLSSIFNWYEEDFGDLVEFLNKYSKISIDPLASIRFMTYDWALNN